MLKKKNQKYQRRVEANEVKLITSMVLTKQEVLQHGTPEHSVLRYKFNLFNDHALKSKHNFKAFV